MILLRQFMLLIYAVNSPAVHLVKMMTLMLMMVIFLHNSPQWARAPHYRGFTITFRYTTVGRIPLDE
jgi:hypothetical protein